MLTLATAMGGLEHNITFRKTIFKIIEPHASFCFLVPGVLHCGIANLNVRVINAQECLEGYLVQNT